MKTIIYFQTCISLLLLSAWSRADEPQSDSTAVVNGFVYEELITQPVEGVTVYIQKLDSAFNLISEDSVITPVDGRFSIEIDTGLYNFIAWLPGYIILTEYSRLNLSNQEYDIDFVLIKPVFHSDIDRIDVSGPYEEPIERKIVISNEGSGKMVFSSVVYLYKDLPPDAYSEISEQHEQSATSKSSVLRYPNDDSWQLLFCDEQDQDPGNHDLSAIWMQKDDDNFYIKAVFYEDIGSFNNFFFNYAMNIDRDPETGAPGGGFDYILVAADFGMGAGAVMVQYINGNWVYMMDASYTYMNAANNYIVIGYPLYILEYYDVMLANAAIRPGMEDFSYYDQIPDNTYIGQFLFSLESDPSILIDKLYGEVPSGGSDTLTLTLLPDIADNPLDTFYIALICNDLASRIVTFQVTIEPYTVNLIHPQTLPGITDVFNYPNPFYETTAIQYNLQEAGSVNLKIYDAQGKLVTVLVNEYQAAGVHVIIWDGTDSNNNKVQPGIYFYMLQLKKMRYHGRLVFEQEE